jgi:hypothetical protein
MKKFMQFAIGILALAIAAQIVLSLLDSYCVMPFVTYSHNRCPQTLMAEHRQFVAESLDERYP